MSLLCDTKWKLKYTPDDGDLIATFYVPALECAVRYDRLTGYFQAKALTLAARGIEGLVRNNGRMRLVVGCTLYQPEVDAIAKGAEWRDQLKAHLLANPLKPSSQREVEALELLAWMVANQILEVKVAVPCDERRRPIPSQGIFHEKAGIIEDKTGDRLAFNGSLNETEAGWTRNWESLNIFRSWLGDDPRVAEEEANFAKLWSDESKHVITLAVPDAAREDLLRFLPEGDQPARLKKPESTQIALPEPPQPAPELLDVPRLVWTYIREAPKMSNGGERVGEATANVEPWPHQVRAFQRLYSNWPPRLLLADEVGLGKTIQAGMFIRQAWLAGKARRVLILAPASLCRQWQIELREKFNLNWPIYDGDQLLWLKSPYRNGPLGQPIARADWHKEPFVIASSHLMRRRERAAELAEQAEPWDILVVDEAHHARRKSPGISAERRPNRLLDLLDHLKNRSQALLLLTATPMQAYPVEVWDLLATLGLPPHWHQDAFLRFYEAIEQESPSHEEMEFLAEMFRTTEQAYGPAGENDTRRAGASTGLQGKRILAALRDSAAVPRRQMDASLRGKALRLIRAYSPISKLISRHTRDLLRRYHKAGKLTTPIADREVEDQFIKLSDEETRLYERVEDYISNTYNQASPKEKNAVGFVMTSYRRRLASSFYALQQTLEDRLKAMEAGQPAKLQEPNDEVEAERTDAEGEVLGREEVTQLEREALAHEEQTEIASLLADIRRLAPDTKASHLGRQLQELRNAGFTQAMVFTQYTDTMDFLREQLVSNTNLRVTCFSGRGGEVRDSDGHWRRISREEAKQRFRSGQADVLLCTDAASEGLNFQFCAALINYDMPWLPMKVEQRIGRIDRLGQQHPKIRILNLYYEGTVEADVYTALRQRIRLFESVVGRLQPILSHLPAMITDHVLDRRNRDADARAAVRGDLERDAEAAKQRGFDLDQIVQADLEEPPRPAAKLTLDHLDKVLQRPELLPPGIIIKKLQAGEYAYQAPGMAAPIRVTTRADYFDDHSESLELWSQGSPAFPRPAHESTAADIDGLSFESLLH